VASLPFSALRPSKSRAGMGAARAGRGKKKKPDSRGAAMIVHVVSTLYMVVCSISIHSYFLWSAVLLAACGIVLAVSGPNIETFLCQMSPQPDQGGLGCEGCADELLLCPKDLCYRGAVNITWQKFARSTDQPLYQQFMQAARDQRCNNLIRNFANNPVQMIQQIASSVDTEPVTNGCVKFHCMVASQALGGASDLDAPLGVCTDIYGMKHGLPEPPSFCPCAGLLTSDETLAAKPDLDATCGTALLSGTCPWGDITPGWCDTTTTATTTATLGAASERRLAGVEEPEQQAAAWPRVDVLQQGIEQEPKQWAVAALASAPSSAPSGVRLEGWGVVTAPPKRGCDERWANASAPRRSLQSSTPSASVELNNVLQAWDVGAWSPCACYQQCMPGLRTRLVTCGTTQCSEPVPAREEHCTCFHCADCPVVLWLFVEWIMFLSTSGVAGLLFLCFLYSSQVKEEQLIKIPFSKKLIGMNCKLVPPIVRLAILTAVGFLVLILAMTFANGILGVEWSKDCHDSSLLRVVSLVELGLVAFQLFLGRCAKRLTRRPAWLYSPVRSSSIFPIKQIRRFLHALSP